MRFIQTVHTKYRVIAGDVISLDAYRQKLKQADQKVREKVKKATIKADPISDDELERFLNAWDTEEYTDLALSINRGLYDLAADYLSGAGALDPDNSDRPKLMASILSRLASYTKEQRDKDLKEVFKNVEVWENKESGESFFFDTHECSESDIDDELEFDSGYDANGKKYNESIFKDKFGT